MTTGIPDVNYRPPIEDLFANFQHNFVTISPALFLVCGVLFAFYVIRKIKNDF